MQIERQDNSMDSSDRFPDASPRGTMLTSPSPSAPCDFWSRWSPSAEARRHRRPTTLTMTALCALILLVIPSSVAGFSLVMKEYKPPVKTSLSQIRNTRYASDASSSSARSSAERRRTRLTTDTSKNAVSAAAASWSPEPPTRQRGSFSDRMRKLVLGQQELQKQSDEIARRFARPAAERGASVLAPEPPKEQPSVVATEPEISTTATSQPKTKRATARPANVLTISSLRDFSQVVSGSQQVVAVRFFAPWCRACRAMAPRYYQMAKENPDVLFVDVPVTDDNANLHVGLGVPSLPYGHLYYQGSGLVTEMSLTKPHLKEFKQQLKSYMAGSCELKELGDASNPYVADEHPSST